MSSPRKRLVLFVEGQADADAAPILVKHLLTEQNAWDCVSLDAAPFQVGNFDDLSGRNADRWHRYLKNAHKRDNLGGILLLLDGDLKSKQSGQRFCPRDQAHDLSRRAMAVGAGVTFSLATVFACREYETWLIASIEALVSPSRHGHAEINIDADFPGGNIEINPRDAKGWLGKHTTPRYKPTTHQVLLTRWMVQNLNPIRQRQLRSFRRLENAVRQLIDALRTDHPVVTPLPPAAPEAEQP
jgi:hypothetical protein